MTHRVNVIDEEIRKCMGQLQSMGIATTQQTSATKQSLRNLSFPLQSVENPIPYRHVKARGMTFANDTTFTGYIAKNGRPITRGDVSFDGTAHYWPNYFSDPVLYYAASVWADPDDTNNINFNCVDKGLNRVSHHGAYALMPYIFNTEQSKFIFGKYPKNPVGVTGISGRGQLGKWGVNHAADPIMVTKRKDGGIYFVSIQRIDTKDWALPGGMVELGDNVSVTLKKEFGEEAMNTLDMSEADKEITRKKIDDVFRNTTTVYQGYVDDPRNTDNAWMETVAVLVVVDESVADTFKLSAGDDAGLVKWKKYEEGMSLYASHGTLIKKAIELFKNQWRQ
jgi:ADP-ribose pyrophosphatase